MLQIKVPCSSLDECYKLQYILEHYIRNSDCFKNGDVTTYYDDHNVYFDIGTSDTSTYSSYIARPNWEDNSIDDNLTSDMAPYPPTDLIGWTGVYNKMSMANLYMESSQLIGLVISGDIHKSNSWCRVEALVQVVYNKLAHDSAGVINRDVVLGNIHVLEDYLEQIPGRGF
jgi:hypothetical protein